MLEHSCKNIQAEFKKHLDRMPMSESTKVKVFANAFFPVERELVSPSEYLSYVTNDVGIVTVETIVGDHLRNANESPILSAGSFNVAVKHLRKFLTGRGIEGSVFDLPKPETKPVDIHKLSSIMFEIADKWYGYTQEQLYKESARIYDVSLDGAETRRSFSNAFDMLVSQKKIRIVEDKVRTSSLDEYEQETGALDAQGREILDKARRIVDQRFPPPQITNDRFMSEIESWDAVITDRIQKVKSIIAVASGHTPKVEDAIKAAVADAKAIILKMDDVIIELTISLNNDSGGAWTREVEDLIDDMEKLIEAIKEYS